METTDCRYDWSLVREAQCGNDAAFAQLVRAHDDGVLKLALRITGSLSDAQDVYQEVFLKAFKKLDRFRFECSFSTWVFRIAMNASLDHLRKNRQRKENDTTRVNLEGEDYDLLNQVPDDSPACNPEKEVLRRELDASILRALRRLTPYEQMVFDLKYVQGMKMRVISEMLNTSESSVKTCLFRATRKLRLDLAQSGTPQMELPS